MSFQLPEQTSADFGSTENFPNFSKVFFHVFMTVQH